MTLTHQHVPRAAPNVCNVEPTCRNPGQRRRPERLQMLVAGEPTKPVVGVSGIHPMEQKSSIGWYPSDLPSFSMLRCVCLPASPFTRIFYCNVDCRPIFHAILSIVLFFHIFPPSLGSSPTLKPAFFSPASQEDCPQAKLWWSSGAPLVFILLADKGAGEAI